jgi:hypothetical protein
MRLILLCVLLKILVLCEVILIITHKVVHKFIHFYVCVVISLSASIPTFHLLFHIIMIQLFCKQLSKQIKLFCKQINLRCNFTELFSRSRRKPNLQFSALCPQRFSFSNVTTYSRFVNESSSNATIFQSNLASLETNKVPNSQQR